MNNPSILKVSLICAAVLITVGATVPQSALAQETGTVPIIKAPTANALARVKDNGTIPIITQPGQNQVTAPPSDSPDSDSFTVTVTVNAPVTEDTVLTLETNHSESIGLPSTATVTAGNSTVTFTVSVTPGQYRNHKDVRIDASCNGTTTSGKIRIDYHGEND